MCSGGDFYKYGLFFLADEFGRLAVAVTSHCLYETKLVLNFFFSEAGSQPVGPGNLHVNLYSTSKICISFENENYILIHLFLYFVF